MLPRPAAARLRLTLAPVGNTARFVVREQLLSAELPNDAVGTTDQVTGGVVIRADGSVDTTASRFTVVLDSLHTDKPNRDKYIKDRTLQTAQFPTARLAVRDVRGLPDPIPANGTLALTIIGDLTIHGVTHRTVWPTEATVRNGVFTGTASTHIKFGDFDMEQPRLMLVVSIVDDIKLEYDFDLIPAAARRRRNRRQRSRTSTGTSSAQSTCCARLTTSRTIGVPPLNASPSQPGSRIAISTRPSTSRTSPRASRSQSSTCRLRWQVRSDPALYAWSMVS